MLFRSCACGMLKCDDDDMVFKFMTCIHRARREVSVREDNNEGRLRPQIIRSLGRFEWCWWCWRWKKLWVLFQQSTSSFITFIREQRGTISRWKFGRIRWSTCSSKSVPFSLAATAAATAVVSSSICPMPKS